MALLLRSALSVILAAALGQSVPALQFRGPASKHATINSGSTPVTAAPGEKVTLFVDMAPNKGVHVYAPGAKDYLPVKVTLKTQSDVKPAGKLVYPKSENLFFAPLNETVPVFQKAFRLSQDVTVAKTAKPGSTVSIDGTLDFQACDDQVCFVPESVPVNWTLTVK
jgi:DsbC/DsbD-like thiol-disulfide interchange protein